MSQLHDQAHAFAALLAEERLGSDRGFPLKRDVAVFVDELLGILFGQLSEGAAGTADELQARLTLAIRDLRHLVLPLARPGEADRIVDAFNAALPSIHDRLEQDARAITEGDPAAESHDEVISAYPGFLAIAIHRLAHELCVLGVPILPRLLAEVAHTRTGIDIHPCATIGRSFCIDHGTGIVIGETALIGNDVKLYQGVTLGALSVAKGAAGTKRHPTIEDRVVIYANATVLGGDTVVGHDSVVGGNVFLTASLPPDSVVYQTSQVRVRRVRDGFDDSDFVI
ncbi:MAG: serine O-acetyltransferase [Candidatus Limnocylindrales bacterium]|nr:serine O-acetyltransferase [Candidatus Limnocylindrales bacterium]